jgi:hypothetical protein
MLNLLFDEKDLNIKYFNILFYNGSAPGTPFPPSIKLTAMI